MAGSAETNLMKSMSHGVPPLLIYWGGVGTLQGYLPGLRAKGWIATAGEGNTARQYLTKRGQEAARRYSKGKH